jgi:hypothetical protein
MARRHTQHRSSAGPGDPGGSRYLVLTGHERRIDQMVVNREEKASLAEDGFDFYHDRACGEMFIKIAEGKIKHFQGRCPFGSETYSLLEEILMAASDFVPLESQDWQYAQVSRMRAVFGDPPGQDHFFEVQKNPAYCIRVQPHIRWRIITVVRDDDSRESV